MKKLAHDLRQWPAWVGDESMVAWWQLSWPYGRRFCVNSSNRRAPYCPRCCLGWRDLRGDRRLHIYRRYDSRWAAIYRVRLRPKVVIRDLWSAVDDQWAHETSTDEWVFKSGKTQNRWCTSEVLSRTTRFGSSLDAKRPIIMLPRAWSARTTNACRERYPRKIRRPKSNSFRSWAEKCQQSGQSAGLCDVGGSWPWWEYFLWHRSRSARRLLAGGSLLNTESTTLGPKVEIQEASCKNRDAPR